MRRVIAAIFVVVFMTNVDLVQSQDRSAGIYTAAVYYLLKFTTWPDETAGDPLTVCSFAPNDEVALLRELFSSKKVRGQKILLLDFRDPLEIDLSRCHAFYSGSEKLENNESHLLHKLKTARNLLSIGKSLEFLEQGGMIQIFKSANRLKIRVHMKQLESSRLKISSEVLEISQKYQAKVEH